jgi:hypothetical protein
MKRRMGYPSLIKGEAGPLINLLTQVRKRRDPRVLGLVRKKRGKEQDTSCGLVMLLEQFGLKAHVLSKNVLLKPRTFFPSSTI